VNERPPDDAEWLESDELGGFASGTVSGIRTRRYHALLITPRRTPSDRVALVNGVEAWAELGGVRLPLSTHRYAPDVIYPRGIDYLLHFDWDPWPRWTFNAGEGVQIIFEIVVDRADGSVLLAWRMVGDAHIATLSVRPLLSGRQFHVLTHENPAFDFTARIVDGNAAWRPYASLPGVAALTNGHYVQEPTWYRNFLYVEEASRGLDCIEDLASPGTFRFDLAKYDATLVLRAAETASGDSEDIAAQIRAREVARRATLGPIDRAADAYIVRRGSGHSIIAGYPWFNDWGRDTFISMRGLVLARRRFEIAGSILQTWASTVSGGMLPNRFADDGQTPEFNSVDASLWYVIVVFEFLTAAPASDQIRGQLLGAATAILDGYAAGTRFGIRKDVDGLLACGVPGTQLTWMDARVGDRVITPRIGKPVEIQALWINALRSAGRRFSAAADRAQAAFAERFWNASAKCLYDVVDVDHVAGQVDARIRPNQILAVGGLPFPVVYGELAAAIVTTVERELLTPMGLRSLARGDAAYRPHYEGGVADRDAAYHQGTVWPWLIGPFVDAWLKVNGDDDAHREEARRRFLAPLHAHTQIAGLGHVSEIADGDMPHAPRGCPFQAWSLGEVIRAMERATSPGSVPPQS
jgi:predicted glycogen debranching enzyme